MDLVRPVKPFDAKVDQSQLASEWRRWKRSLEYCLEAQGVTSQREKRNQLLHLGGPDLQDIFDSLPEVNNVPHVSPDPPFYDVAIEQLDAHFQPSRRRTYERHIFRQISQQQGERFNDFVMKLRVQANRCDFDQEGTSVLESMIIDQIAEKCISSALRKKILEKDRPLSEVVAIGKTIEEVEIQCKELVQLSERSNPTMAVNKVQQYRPRPQSSFPTQPEWSYQSSKERGYQFPRPQQYTFRRDQRFNPKGNWPPQPNTRFRQPPFQMDNDNRLCFACGRRGHVKDSPKCVAKNAECLQCKRVGHFAKWCTKRPYQRSDLESNETSSTPPVKRIKMVQQSEDVSKPEGSVDEICYIMGQNVFRFTVGGVEIPMAIDSGAAANLIDPVTWEHLKKANAKINFQANVDRTFKAYGSEDLLELTGMFTAEIEAGGNTTQATFYIAKDGRQCLLGDDTAKELKVLKIGYNIDAVREQTTTFPKIKGVIVEIPINSNIPPVQQPYRRVPFALEDKIAQKLGSLLDQDIIERVRQPSAWVSPVVPILKDSGEIRLCVDMRRANQAVLRETHPLPLVEELFAGIKGAQRFSKLDIKEAYHQVEISERSREITTFITKQGLFR